MQFVDVLLEVPLERGAKAAVLAQEGLFLLVHCGNVSVQRAFFCCSEGALIAWEGFYLFVHELDVFV